MKIIIRFLIIALMIITSDVCAQDNDTTRIEITGKIIVIDSLSNIAKTNGHWFSSMTKYLLLCEPDSNINKCLGNKRIVLRNYGEFFPNNLSEGKKYKFTIKVFSATEDNSIDYKSKSRSPCFSYILKEDNEKIYLIDRIE